MTNVYEVKSPWAEAEAVPLHGVSPRLSGLDGKVIGLFSNGKVAARPVLSIVADKLKERIPSLRFSYFLRSKNTPVEETEDKDKFIDWVKEVDGVILAVGD